ncbi:GAF and ANTAR domain-containing protein [Actinosynnema sp. NPDC047251]|uniref:ANTAR domain-containing protein n=1 Tax=Saccharothrix espanaensis (strain ATCC 51144 / DSM 44229 / JCM 9112 / NBRC 15066 / NRRL 15764) TaxID=1179773 RepID=K0K632_SACES|nr:GAF and ANTAR domain-containing protein [Saccharothrix espanaensis]CCH32344.1 hypothetical protein BN6_50780 [Saccharothrix espanaensis DSM 44229]
MDGRRHEELWRLVTTYAQDHPPASGWVSAVCAVALGRIDVDAAAITVRAAGRTQQLAAASDAWAASLEELQYTVGEGPGMSAFRDGEAVLVGDLNTEAGRWPGFVHEAATADVRAAFAFPLRVGAIQVGTFALYRHRAGPLDAEGFGDAVALADLATTALLTDSKDEKPVASWAREDVSSFYDDVNMAIGMLATLLQINLEDALLRLRAYAYSNQLPLTEVARQVLSRELRLDSAAE